MHTGPEMRQNWRKRFDFAKSVRFPGAASKRLRTPAPAEACRVSGPSAAANAPQPASASASDGAKHEWRRPGTDTQRRDTGQRRSLFASTLRRPRMGTDVIASQPSRPATHHPQKGGVNPESGPDERRGECPWDHRYSTRETAGPDPPRLSWRQPAAHARPGERSAPTQYVAPTSQARAGEKHGTAPGARPISRRDSSAEAEARRIHES